VPTPAATAQGHALKEFTQPSEKVSCGGGFFPPTQNTANVFTPNPQSFVLPTEAYSVLVLKPDGNAVIYSDEEAPENDEDFSMPDFSKKDEDPEDEGP
jgi:hypothetical protein